jgi:hypothetical protein
MFNESSEENSENYTAQIDKTQTEDNFPVEKEPHHQMFDSETQNNIGHSGPYNVNMISEQKSNVPASPPKFFSN